MHLLKIVVSYLLSKTWDFAYWVIVKEFPKNHLQNTFLVWEQDLIILC